MSPPSNPAGPGERPREDGLGDRREEQRRKARGTPGLACELCGGPVLDRHCKIVCLNCGYQRDCSDP